MQGRLPPGRMFPAGEQDLRQRYVGLASGLSVRVVEAGEAGNPPVVLVPGWGCSAWIFHETLSPLGSAGFHAIAVELKGHGMSDKPTDPAEYTTQSMTNHLLEILDSLSLKSAAMVGHSMGGAIAAHAAASEPSSVSALALVAPVGFAGVFGMSVFQALTPAIAISALPHLAKEPLIRTMLSIVYGDLRRPGERDVAEFVAPAQFEGFTTALRHLLHQFDWHAPYPALGMPVTILAGTKDRLCPPGEARRLLKGGEPIIIDGAGHVILDEAPEKVNASLIDFFRKHGRSSVYFA